MIHLTDGTMPSSVHNNNGPDRRTAGSIGEAYDD